LYLKFIFFTFINRLQRVRQRQQYGRPDNDSESGLSKDSNTIELFGDYVIYDKTKKHFLVGNLVRVILDGQNGKVEYRRPVSYQDPKKQKIHCYFQLYDAKKIDGKDVRGKFVYTSLLKQFCLTEVISHTNLIIEEDGSFTMPAEELHEFETTVLERAGTTRRREETQGQQLEDDNGVSRIVVIPEENTTGLRRSCRKRTVVQYSS
jgi:hypothetical protein